MMKYNTYKPSENQWFKQVPLHWETFRFIDKVFLKHGFQFRDYDFTDEGIKVIKITQLNPDGSLDTDNCSFIDSARLGEFKSIKISEGDILMALTGGTIGKIIRVGKVREPLLQNYRVGNFFPNKKALDKTYLYFLLSSQITEEQINYLLNRNGQPNIGKESFKNMFFPLPPFEEQSQIAQYLEVKAQAIDKKVSLLTKKADYYKDLRKSIINDSVCKGLDKNVKQQVSEFAFSVNANWKRYRLKDLGFLYSGLSGKAGDDFNQDDNPNNKGFIPFTNIANNTYLKANHLGSVVVFENEKQNKVRKGDLFFLMSSEGYDDVGKTAALAEDIPDTYLNSFCKGYRITKKNCEPYFLNYLLLSDNYRKSLITEGKGFTRINLKMEKVTDFFVYLPATKEEQTAIANFLDEKTQKIDAIISNIGKQIKTLKELRKTLINDVVTGKIKVTE